MNPWRGINSMSLTLEWAALLVKGLTTTTTASTTSQHDLRARGPTEWPALYSCACKKSNLSWWNVGRYKQSGRRVRI